MGGRYASGRIRVPVSCAFLAQLILRAVCQLLSFPFLISLQEPHLDFHSYSQLAANNSLISY